MDKKNIEELRKILYSKIDQLGVLIGDNFKTIHYDYFTINSTNLDEQLLKIREIFKQNPSENLEVLVMKKDIVNLTKEFLNKNILEELKQEKRKLKRVRIIYSILLFLLILLGTLAYWNYFKNFFTNFKCPKTQCVSNNLASQKASIISPKPNKNISTWNDLTWENLATIISTWEILSWATVKKPLTWNQLTWNILTENTQVFTGQITTWNQLSWVKLEKNKIQTITWIFLFWVITFHHQITGNTYNWTMKILKVLKNKKINLSGFSTKYDFNKSIYSTLKFRKLPGTGDTLSGTFVINWTTAFGTILWEVLTGKIYNFQPIDQNEQSLSWEALKEYIQEKQKKCPYTGIIKVNVYALNLRESNTKYSKKLWLLRKWTPLKVLGCEKNLQADSWWYKVKTPSGKVGWVSTIGVGK